MILNRHGAMNTIPAKTIFELGFRWWSRLVSNQRPSACEADALPLSYETREVDRTGRTTSKIITRGRVDPNPRGRHCAHIQQVMVARWCSVLLAAVAVFAAVLAAGRVRWRVHRRAVRKCPVTNRTDDDAAGPRADKVTNAAPADREVDGLTRIHLADGQCRCMIDADWARCDIIDRDWSPPPGPRTASSTTGRGSRSRPASRPNSSAPATPPSAPDEVLPYGESITAGVLRCESAEAGITCRDTPDRPRLLDFSRGVSAVLTSPDRGSAAGVEICAATLGWTIVVLRDGRRCRSWRADVAQLVAHHLAKVRVAGSNPVVRSKVQVASTPAVEWPRGEATACKAVYTGSNPVSTSKQTPRD